MAEKPQYWFPAKRFGWGWGMPAVWQGWAVLAAFFAALVACAVKFLPRQMVAFQLSVLGLTMVLVVVCYFKGEPPAGRWGNRS